MLVYPTDRAAYGRLCRLLTIGKARAGKGKCSLFLDDVVAWSEGLIAILVTDKPSGELPQQLKRICMLVEAVTDYAIYMLDPKGIVSSWNPGARRFKGYEPAEIIGKHFSNFYTDEDKAAGIPQRALETAEREGKFESKGWRVRKDDGKFWAYVIIDPNVTTKLIGFAKVTRDLTERKEAEDSLKKTQEQFRLLVQGVTDYAIYLLSPEGNVTSWNPGAQRIKC